MVRMHIRKGRQGLAALARLVTHPARWIAGAVVARWVRNSQARPPETGARECTRVAIETVSTASDTRLVTDMAPRARWKGPFRPSRLRL